MPVQGPQHRRRIGAAATQARLAGDPLGDSDFQAAGILAQSVTVNLRRLPGQVAFVGGDVLLVAFQAPRLTGAHIHLNIVTDGDGLHDTFQIMVAVLPFAKNVQCQIHFCKSAFVKGGHRESLRDFFVIIPHFLLLCNTV